MNENISEWKPRYRIENGYIVYSCECCAGLKFVYLKGGGVARCRECLDDDMDAVKHLDDSFGRRLVWFDSNIHERLDARFTPDRMLPRLRQKECNMLIDLIMNRKNLTEYGDAADKCFEWAERYHADGWRRTGVELLKKQEEYDEKLDDVEILF